MEVTNAPKTSTKLSEPFPNSLEEPAGATGTDLGDGILIPHRRTIKTRSDAPHLMVCIPIGGREEQAICVCPSCGTRSPEAPVYRAPGTVPAELLANITNVMPPLGVTVSFMFLKNDLSAVLREKMTVEAIRQNADFIFYWDDDTIIPGDTWYKMLVKMKKYPDIGAITGVYYTKLEPSEPVLYKDAGKGAYWGTNPDPSAEPEDVFAAGAGCLMARMETIKKMEPPYWTDERHANEEMTSQHISGHDIRFCRKVREETGYRMTVDGSVDCIHIDAKSQRAFQRPKDVPPHQMAREMSDGFVGETDLVEPQAEPQLNRTADQVMSLFDEGHEDDSP